jgi:hypothetical protein
MKKKPDDAQIFKMHPDRRSKRITWSIIAAFVLVNAYFTYEYFNSGAYVPAWFSSIVLTVAALYILSIPRSLRVAADVVEIRCVLELTRIRVEDLHSIKRMESRKTGLTLLLGSYGFFGYYGYFLDRRRWEIVRMYIRKWDDLVEIEDIYEQRYVVSCDDSEAFIRAVVDMKAEWEKNRPAFGESRAE